MPSQYTVKSGDSLSKIAQAHGVTLGELLKANAKLSQDGRNPSLIYPGEAVMIPGKSAFSSRVSVKCGTTTCAPVSSHARLQLKSVMFSGGNEIDNDTFGNFDTLKGLPTPHFLVGRAADLSPLVQRPAQFPYSIPRATKLGLTAIFEVTQKPVTSELVALDAEVTVNGTMLRFRCDVTVGPSDTEVTTARLASDVELPNTILKVDPLTLNWFQTPSDMARHAAGSSTNTLYVTRDVPTKSPLHWTLLEVSCAAASGKTTIAELRTLSYGALQTRAIKRARDKHDLTYWNPQIPGASSTQLLLAAPNGSGECGAWADFLIDMWKAHGDDRGHKVIIAQDIIQFINNLPVALFLVKDWRFDPPHPSNPRTFHYEFQNKCFETPGVPGQNNPNPPPHFANHFIVIADGKFYDPSYGSPVFSTKLEWENASIDGLGNGNYKRGNHGGYRKSDLSSTQLLQFADMNTGKFL